MVLSIKEVYIKTRVQRLRPLKLKFAKGKKISKPAFKATATPTKMLLTKTVEKPITGTENNVQEIPPIDMVALNREGNTNFPLGINVASFENFCKQI